MSLCWHARTAIDTALQWLKGNLLAIFEGLTG